MNVFQQIAGAQIEGVGISLPEGVYGIQINRCHMFPSQNPQSKNYGKQLAVIEFVVTASNNTNVAAGDGKYSLVEKAEEKFGQSAIKAMICAVLGVDRTNEAKIAQYDQWIATGLGLAVFDARNVFGPVAPGAEGLHVAVQIIARDSKSGHAYKKHVYFPAPHIAAQEGEVLRRWQATPQPQAAPPPAPSPFAPQHGTPPGVGWQPPPAAPMPPSALAPNPYGLSGHPPAYTPVYPGMPAWPSQGVPAQPPAPVYPPGYGAPVYPMTPAQPQPPAPPPYGPPGMPPGGYNPQR